jgi:Rrf2 family transcriptional regulator, iron-sulfur cluster assembly transcription factor
MLLSKSCIYGLRASVLLAQKKNDGFITIRELSDELNISFHFLTKVLQELTKSELLESYKGPNGGVKLARPAGKITFMDVVLSIDGDYMIKECVLGLPGCGVMKPCALHDQWSDLKNNILAMMKEFSLEEVANNRELQAAIERKSIKISNL